MKPGNSRGSKKKTAIPCTAVIFDSAYENSADDGNSSLEGQIMPIGPVQQRT